MDDDSVLDPTTGELALSIGAVAKATGIPANTLRTWERRYGFPVPRRTDSGHRMFGPEVVPRLRLISRALDEGHRPAQIVGLPMDQLRQLVDPVPLVAIKEQGSSVAPWLDAARRLDGPALDAALAHECARTGLEEFLVVRAAELIKAVGDAWAAGELEVFQEHWVSERLRDFLASQWRPLSQLSRGPTVVCAAPEGERHVMGLHLVAGVAALAGMRVVFLGPDTPIPEMLSCVRLTGAPVLAVSLSSQYPTDQGEVVVAALARALPEPVRLLVGGAGAPDDIPDAHVVRDLAVLSQWLRVELGLR